MRHASAADCQAPSHCIAYGSSLSRYLPCPDPRIVQAGLATEPRRFRACDGDGCEPLQFAGLTGQFAGLVDQFGRTGVTTSQADTCQHGHGRYARHRRHRIANDELTRQAGSVVPASLLEIHAGLPGQHVVCPRVEITLGEVDTRLMNRPCGHDVVAGRDFGTGQVGVGPGDMLPVAAIKRDGKALFEPVPAFRIATREHRRAHVVHRVAQDLGVINPLGQLHGARTPCDRFGRTSGKHVQLRPVAQCPGKFALFRHLFQQRHRIVRIGFIASAAASGAYRNTAAASPAPAA